MSSHFPSDLSDEVCNFFHGPVYKFYVIKEFFFNAYGVTLCFEKSWKERPSRIWIGGGMHSFS